MVSATLPTVFNLQSHVDRKREEHTGVKSPLRQIDMYIPCFFKSVTTHLGIPDKKVHYAQTCRTWYPVQQ